MSRLLIVEDEESLGRGLAFNFEAEGYSVVWVATVAEALRALETAPPDLVVLDLTLPDGDGLSLLERIKRRDPRQLVLVLTARAGDLDRIRGLSLGADDYLTKPFHLKELMLRVEGMLRRRAWYQPSAAEEFEVGGARVRPAQAEVVRGGQVTPLTDLELRLLVHLWQRRGQWVGREELLVEVWGYAPETNTRTVDAFMSRLRRLLGDSGTSPQVLLTRRGKGYMVK